MKRGLLLAVLVIASTALGLADEGADLDKDLARCRYLLTREKWKEAGEAYRSLFTTHEMDPRVVAKLRDIEDGLKRALFKSAYRKPTGKDLFGDAATSFSVPTRKVKLRLGDVSNSLWKDHGGGVMLLNVKFEPTLKLSVWGKTLQEGGAKGPRPLVVAFCYDPGMQNGYTVCPGAMLDGGRYYPRTIIRFDRGKKRSLYTGDPSRSGHAQIKVERTTSKIKVDVDGFVMEFKDKEYRDGYVGLFNSSGATLEIDGRIERGSLTQLLGEHESTSFAKWEKKTYRREEVIPEWARNPKAESSRPLARLLPADWTLPGREQMEVMVRAAVLGDPAAGVAIMLVTEQCPPDSRRFLTAVADLATGRLRAADEGLGPLLEAQPDFAPGLAVRGLARLRLRRLIEARTDLTAAKLGDPALGIAYLGLMHLSIVEGRLDLASKALEDAAANRVALPGLEEWREIVHRVARGPLMAGKHELRSTHFDLASDVSDKLLKEVSRTLESALGSYRITFPAPRHKVGRARVYVFSSQKGYLAYAKALGRDLRGSAGAYVPTVRELVLFMPEYGARFQHTVRHEGFHMFLHSYLEDVPLWFDEGCAEYFACGEERFGVGLKPGAPNKDALRTLKSHRTSLTPLPELLVMPAAEFMKKPELHYAQAWAVVHFLMKSPDKTLRALVERYFTALQDGLSAEEAYEKVLKQKVAAIEKGYRLHAIAMPR